MSDWCKGFCRSCGTACAEYCEDIAALKKDLCDTVDKLALAREALEKIRKEPCCDSGMALCCTSHEEWAREALENIK